MHIEQVTLSAAELADLRLTYRRRRHAALARYEALRSSDAGAFAARNLAAAYHPHREDAS